MKPEAVEHDPERPVFEAIQQGDPHALAELMHRQGPWVRGVIFAVLGRADELDDVAQKVWMQVWREGGKLADTARWRVWLYRVAHNAARDFGRSKQRRRRLLDRVLDRQRFETCRAAPADQAVLSNERQQVMLDAIAALPPLYREPFVLKHMDDWSYARIGEALGLPTDTVETRLVRARRLLREQLAGKV